MQWLPWKPRPGVHSCLSLSLAQFAGCWGHCWVLVVGSAFRGAGVLFHQRESWWPEATPVLQPCPAARLGSCVGPQKILKPFNRVKVGALRLLWARDDFTVTSLA